MTPVHSEAWQEGWEAAICRCPDGYCVCVSHEAALEKAREAAKYAVIKSVASEMQEEVRYWLGYAERTASLGHGDHRYRPAENDGGNVDALAALERARAAWERSQPQLMLDFGLDEAPLVGTVSRRARPTAPRRPRLAAGMAGLDNPCNDDRAGCQPTERIDGNRPR